MASGGPFASTEIESFIRGFHDYRHVWQPEIGESLIFKNEPSNAKDRLAVSVQKEGQVVGHVPRNLAPLLFYFLNREANKGFVKVKARAVNRGAGMGMEVPCVYTLCGSVAFIKRLEDTIKKKDMHDQLRPHVH